MQYRITIPGLILLIGTTAGTLAQTELVEPVENDASAVLVESAELPADDQAGPETESQSDASATDPSSDPDGEAQSVPESPPLDVQRFEGVDRVEARSLYNTHFAAEQFAEAIDAARYGVLLTEQEFGPRSVELVPALNDLGLALLKTRQADHALIHFERSANLVQYHDGLFSKQLLDPLMGQGYAQQQLGRHEAAVNSFRRGQHIVHRNDGVLGLDQIPAIEATSTSYAALDEAEKAEQLRLLTFKIYRRKFGGDDPRMTTGLYSLARWYSDQGDNRQALALYGRALQIQKQAGGDIVQTLPALQGMARVYSRRHGDSALKNALKVQTHIVSELENQPVTQDKVFAHLELGDLLIRDDKADEAWLQYRAALTLSEQYPQANWSALFAEPVLIYAGPHIGEHSTRSDEPGYYDFSSTIGIDGVPIDIKSVATNMRGQTRSVALQSFKRARFRPRMAANEPVPTEGYVFRRIYSPLIRQVPRRGARF